MKYYRSNSVLQKNSLAHFGIFGMKWGVRRFQNEDGTLTEEGKKRYAKRERDVEYAKDFAKQKTLQDLSAIRSYEEDAKKVREMPATRSAIKKKYGIDDDTYDSWISESGSAKEFKKSEEQYYNHLADIHRKRISIWNERIKQLSRIKVDAIASDRDHQKQIEDVFAEGKGFLVRNIELQGIRNHLDAMRIIGDVSDSIKNNPSRYTKAIRDLDKIINSKDPKIKRIYSEEDMNNLKKQRKELADKEQKIIEDRNRKHLESINKTLKNYKEQHPNTKLSDDEILLMKYGYNPKKMYL